MTTATEIRKMAERIAAAQAAQADREIGGLSHMEIIFMACDVDAGEERMDLDAYCEARVSGSGKGCLLIPSKCNSPAGKCPPLDAEGRCSCGMSAVPDWYRDQSAARTDSQRGRGSNENH